MKVNTNGSELFFWCPGCETVHGVTIEGDYRWNYNDDPEHPTITPSILVNPHLTIVDDDLLTTAMTPRCHSYITNGRIEYLPDSTHPLTGQTTDLPDWPH